MVTLQRAPRHNNPPTAVCDVCDSCQSEPIGEMLAHLDTMKRASVRPGAWYDEQEAAKA
jgi:hypothetical protein